MRSLGIARLNVYSGLSGFYFVRERFPSLANGPELPGLPYPAYDGTIDPMLVRELPLAIQDRAFTNESQLWYPVADHPGNNSLPTGAVPPRSLPEFSASVFANGVPVNMVMMTVNGRTYPRQVRGADRHSECLMSAEEGIWHCRAGINSAGIFIYLLLALPSFSC
jgi:spore coat protein A